MLRGHAVRIFAISVLTALSIAVQAQVLLKPAGGYMEPLHQKSIDADVKITGQFATTKMTHIFANPSHARIEAEFIYTLPEGATVTSFAYWCGEEKVVAYVAEKERAKEIYRSITSRQRDPALVELINKHTFHAKIFPVMPDADLKVEVTWVNAIPSSKGVPTYVLPIKMKAKEDQLQSLKVHVEINKEPWLKSVANNYGLTVHDATDKTVIDMDSTKVRPAQDLRIALIPYADQLVASVFSGRSAGADGYFAANVISANKPEITAAGVKLFSVHQSRSGANVIVTGKYRGSGTGTLSIGKRSIPINLSDEAKPDHLAVKLWAVDEIERLTKNKAKAKDIIALSMQHGMPSKYTAWIAIPAAERKLYERLIKEAKLNELAKSYVKEYFDRQTETSEMRSTKKDIEAFCKELGRDTKWTLEEFAYDEIYSRIARMGKDLHQGSRPSLSAAKKRIEGIRSVTKELGINADEAINNTLSGQLWETIEKQVEHEILGRPDSPKDRRNREIVDLFSSLTGTPKNAFEQEHLQTAVNTVAEELLGRAYRNEISDSERKEIVDRIVNFVAKRKVPPTGFYLGNYWNAGQDLAKAHLKEKVDKKGLAAANRWLDTVVMLKFGERNATIGQSVTNYLMSRSYTDINGYFQESAKSSYISAESVKHLKNLAKIWENCDPAIRDSANGPLSNLTQQVGRDLGYRAVQMHDLPKANAKLEEIKKVFLSVYPNSQAASDKALQKAFDDSVKQSVSSYAWNVYYSRSSLRQRKSDIQKQQEEFNEMAKWAGLDAEKLYRETIKGLDPESAVRYELLQAHLSGSTDRAKIAQLETKLKELTQEKSKTFREDRIERIRVNAMADRIQDELDEVMDADKRSELNKQYNEYLRQAQVIAARMGDPLLTAKLPETCTNVTATFPWGEVRPMTWNYKTKQFECRFDIPPTATEGEQDVIVRATGMLGDTIVEKSPIHVDVTAPRFDVSVHDGRVEVNDLSGDIARARVFTADGQPVDMVRGAGSTWWAKVDSSEVRIVATDRAHNRSEYPAPATETPVTLPKVAFGPAVSDFSGHNVQTLGKLGEKVFAGTLDEGLWVRAEAGIWQEIKGLPSMCPRTMVEFDGQLIVRFGDGNLIAVAPDLTWKSIGSNLPRHEAMGLANDGTMLFVAQPGGYSEFDGQNWKHHFDIEALRGQSVSAFAATSTTLWIGLQGKGLVSIDRTSGETKSFDERSGLTDDWVTQIQPLGSDVVVGTFVGGALTMQDGKFVPLSGTHEKCVTSIAKELIGTRTGLFQLESGSLRQVESAGMGEEIQAVVQTGGTVWIGTRNGVIRVTR